MSDTTKCRAIVCSCEDTVPLDLAGLQRACKGLEISGARHACRTELDTFRAKATDGRLVVACTQEQPLFAELAEAEGLGAELGFVNVREAAGWSSEAKAAGPKIAALLAAAVHTPPPVPFVSFESKGVTLILGRDETALRVAQALTDALDITVLLSGEADVAPMSRATVPVRRGIARIAKGYLGAFEVSIDGFAEPAASSRAAYAFGPVRNGLVSRADIVIDLTGRAPLFPAHDLRDGYLRADPGNAIEIEHLIRKAAGLVGTFDKPRYVQFKDELCAHSRSRITGCTRCLDLCPVGAITPAGNHVAIDPHICGGCGQCGAACPTGAASYALPPVDHLITRIRTLLTTYRSAGGTEPVLLFHDRAHGTELIEAAARHSRGLPARIIPLDVNEVTAVGLEAIAATFAYGAAHVRFLLRAKPRHDPAGLHQTLELATRILRPLGYGTNGAATIETDDPDMMLDALDALPDATPAPKPAAFMPGGGKRAVLVLALRELNRVAPSPVDEIALPPKAPMGRVAIDAAGCTLCLSCVSACPTSALTAGDDRPLLRFDESLCVQCGLCKATCPEKVVSLEPRLSFKAFADGPIMLKEEEPFCCISCGKAFGVKSTIERIVSKLEGRHWMYTGANAARLDLVKMCEDCRVTSVTNAGLDPYAAAPRPNVRTTEDYYAERERERAKRKDSDDSGGGRA